MPLKRFEPVIGRLSPNFSVRGSAVYPHSQLYVGGHEFPSPLLDELSFVHSGRKGEIIEHPVKELLITIRQRRISEQYIYCRNRRLFAHHTSVLNAPVVWLWRKQIKGKWERDLSDSERSRAAGRLPAVPSRQAGWDRSTRTTTRRLGS